MAVQTVGLMAVRLAIKTERLAHNWALPMIVQMTGHIAIVQVVVTLHRSNNCVGEMKRVPVGIL